MTEKTIHSRRPIMNKTIVRFYRGTHGMGICISITYDKDRIIFDFGAPFTPLTQVYDGEVKPRNKNRVKDTILLGKIPAIQGVFSKKDLQDLDLLSYEDSDLNTAVMICHLHLDHMSEIDKIAPEIPVYIHSDGIRLLKLLYTVNNEKEYRSYTPFEYHVPFHVGQIRITPYYSDHPCPGSSGFLIETPDSKIYYSGDIRFHGTGNQRAFEELDTLKESDIDLLIVDATTTSPSEFVHGDQMDEILRDPSKDLIEGCISEKDIYDEIYDSLIDFKGLGVFNQYERDTSMMKQIYDLGKRLNRTVVFEPSMAYIFYHFTGIKAPICWIDSIDIPEYQIKMKEGFEVVSVDEIRNHPERYLLQNSYNNILSLTDLDGIKGKYFHLFGEPLVKGQKQWKIMENVLEKLNWKFRSFSNLYSFSHAYPNQLAYFIEQIDPKTVVAVHSKNPERLNPVNSAQVFPEENRDYHLLEGKLIKIE